MKHRIQIYIIANGKLDINLTPVASSVWLDSEISETGNKSKESLEDSSETKKKQTRNRIQNATEMNVENFLNSLRNVKI